jgi:hypothetical protein
MLTWLYLCSPSLSRLNALWPLLDDLSADLIELYIELIISKIPYDHVGKFIEVLGYANLLNLGGFSFLFPVKDGIL